MADPYSKSLTRRQTTAHTESIKTAKLINKLQDHALSGDDPAEMKATQIRAADALLNRTMPVLKALDHTSGGEAMQVVINKPE
jgi:hypothetical protein